MNYKGYPKTICTSVNQVICHGIPDHKKILKNGDIMNIDVTVIKDGYHGDTSKMYAIGNIKLYISDSIHFASVSVITIFDNSHINIHNISVFENFFMIRYSMTNYLIDRSTNCFWITFIVQASLLEL